LGAVSSYLSLTSVSHRSRLRKSFRITSLLAIVALVLLPFLFKLDGKAHADWQQFLGRFHPLIVHLPIGLIVLLPLLEIAGKFRPALREAAAFVLSLSLLACLSAVAFGYLLAYGSGEIGAGVTRHMWGGIALTIAVLLCWVLRPWWASGKLRGVRYGVYPGLLICVLLLLIWTAHQGGSLTHGDNYLFEYLPAPLKRLTNIWKSQAVTLPVSNSFYARHVHPVLDANCVGCHGDGSTKGGLRVDSYEHLMKGGQEGAVIIPGEPAKSILLQRVTLPAGHKNFMPAEGKPPLKPEEIVWIRTWIAQGASPTISSLTGLNLPDEIKDEPLPQVGDYSRLMPEMAQTAKSEGVTIVPVSKNPGDGLILNTVDASPNFTDTQLVKFEKFAPYIVEIELGRTSVTDACFDTLAKFSHLRALHLEETAVTGVGLTKLTQLSQLTYLNLSGTRVSEAAIAPLGSIKTLRHLYLYNTPAQPVATAPPGKSTPRKTS
jgi:uncharacterized membrane protein